MPFGTKPDMAMGFIAHWYTEPIMYAEGLAGLRRPLGSVYNERRSRVCLRPKTPAGAFGRLLQILTGPKCLLGPMSFMYL